MKSLISFNAEFYEKIKFQQNEEDSFTLAFAKAILVFLILFLVWNSYSHYKQLFCADDLMEPSFYYSMYAIALSGIGLVLWWMKRLKKNIEKEMSIE